MLLVLAGVVMPILRIWPGSKERSEIRCQHAIHQFTRIYFSSLQWMGIASREVRGAERLLERGQLIVANHPTLLDALLLMSLMPQADCVVKERYYQNPFLGGPARGAGYVVSRNGPGMVEKCVEHLKRGRTVIIFPEGTRSPAGGLGPFARGAAHIAIRSGLDPIPVTIRCEPATLFHGQAWWDVPDRRFTLSLAVGEPVPIEGALLGSSSRGRAARAITETLRNHFEKGMSVVRS
jgi:1-acyl-sn-glycerol-3-phosphate acyltransferase